MTLRLAILCSGQGAQHRGMFDLALTVPGMAARIEGWSLPVDADPFENRNAQPLVVGAACAIWQALQPRLPAPVVVAGYSVGEVAALAVAGVITPQDAVALARTRAALMDACVTGQQQGLAAVSGLSQATLVPLLACADATAYMAIENGEDQWIVGGLISTLEALHGLVESGGGRMQRLPVSVASHTPLMAAAVQPLLKALGRIHRSAPDMRLLAGVSGTAATDGAAAMQALAAQTTATVRWSACMDAIVESGATAALELGPGSALARMMATRHPHVACRAVDDFRSVDGLVTWLMRHAD